MFSCQELLDELSNYLDDQVAVEVRRELEEHMSRCHTCRVLIDSTRRTVKIVAGCRSFELPAGLSVRIMAHIREKIQADQEES